MPEDIEEVEFTDHKKISTGIVGLDYQLGGGYPEGCIIVIQGSPVSGIEKIAEQFWKADEETTGADDSAYLMSDSSLSDGMTPVKPDEVGDTLLGISKRRCVVDSLSSVIRENGADAAIGLMKDAAGTVAQTGGNVLFLLYDGVHSPADEIAVIRYADVYIHLIEERHGNEIERKMEISKLKYANIPNRMYPYDITHEGIDLSTTARVV